MAATARAHDFGLTGETLPVFIERTLERGSEMKRRGNQVKGLYHAASSILAMAVVGAFAPAFAADVPTLSAEQKACASKLYFERCAGCHGILRKGATGKNLEPVNTLKLNQARLENIISYGTDGGMVNFDDILTKEEISMMAKYIQITPDAPPEWGMKDMMDSWKLVIKPEDRPKKQMKTITLKHVFSVTLRDSGEVALIDGDTQQIWGIVKTGYAGQSSPVSKTGAAVYAIGPDSTLH